MANTLKFGNGQWYGKKDTILAYNDENKNYKPLPFSFDRASSATVINKEGLIETVGSGEPRIDYKDDSKGALLLEPSRTNLITYSEDFSNASWANAEDAIITNNSNISPTGELNGTLFASGNSNNFHRISHSLSISNATSYTHSIFVKKQNFNYFTFRYNLGSGGYSNVCFDLNDGVLIYNGLNCTPSIEKYKDDWYRLSISFTSIGTTGTVIYYISENPITSNTITTYTGDGTSGVYIWGAQLEQGSYATSYIPTQGSIGTRVAESCSDAGNDQVINSTEGTIYLEVEKKNGDNTKRRVTINNDSSSVFVNIEHTVSGNIKAELYDGSNVSGTITSSNLTQDNNKIAYTYKVNEFKLFINGIQIGNTVTTGGTISSGVLKKISLDNGNGYDVFKGKVKEIKLYNTALTDAELQALTQV